MTTTKYRERMWLFVVSFLCVLTIVPGPVARALSAKTISGDWIVSTHQTVENRAITLKGSLRVVKGGKLVLRNAELTVEQRMDGRRRIRVEEGGVMTIERGCIISCTSDFSFYVEKGAVFTMKDSTLHHCGFRDPLMSLDHADEHYGLTIAANNAVIDNNLFSWNSTGVYLYKASGVRISSNRFVGNRNSGVAGIWSHRNTIAGNSMSGSTTGVYLHACNENAISANTLTEVDTGVLLSECRNSEVLGNRIILNPRDPTRSIASSWTGIFITKRSDGNRVFNNEIAGGLAAIVCTHGRCNVLQGNTLTGAALGISLGYCRETVVANNVVSDAGDQCLTPGSQYNGGGLLLFQTADSYVLNNRFWVIGQYDPGVMLACNSTGNKIAGNSINASCRGLFIHCNSDNNLIVGNSISASVQEAVVINDSSHNNVHHNNFGGAQPPFDDGKNTWDDERVGNAWSHYDEKEPLSIYPNGHDRFPQKSPLSGAMETIPDVKAPPSRERPPKSSKVVSDDKTIEGQEITLNDPLTIASGGRLVIKNSTIWANGDVDAQIQVERGGALHILNSAVLATDEGGGFWFRAQPGSSLVISNSRIRGAGFCVGGAWLGVMVHCTSPVIENSEFGDSFRGLYLAFSAKQAKVIGNTITDCVQGIVLQGEVDEILISGNIIRRTVGPGILLERSCSGSCIESNRIQEVWSWGGIRVLGVLNRIINNTITSLRGEQRVFLKDANPNKPNSSEGNTVEPIAPEK